MEPFRVLTGRTVVLPMDDVDTDQIIPARFLKGTTRSGLGRGLFADRRYAADGSPRPDFALNRAEAAGAPILVTGRNFGCGSSREHAVWALADQGFRAVIGPSFADIFRGNALKNGLLPVAIPADVHARLAASSGATVTIDLEKQEVALPDGARVAFAVDPFARHCLLHGIDELDFLLGQEEAINAYESTQDGNPGGGRTAGAARFTRDAEAGGLGGATQHPPAQQRRGK
jgi:3-isopropylmalate/(R)-2-methylmalate dehydratase small subunit